MTRPRRGTRRSRSDRGRAAPTSSATERCLLSGKRCYESEDAAMEEAFSFMQNNRFSLSSRSAYRCACGSWHITGGKR
jgi:hypothetical protein